MYVRPGCAGRGLIGASGTSFRDAVDGSSTGTRVPSNLAFMLRAHDSQEPGDTKTEAVTVIGLDIAKSFFQVHRINAEGKVVIRRQLKRRYVLPFFQKVPPCLVGIEACASSHYWSRELRGHYGRRSCEPHQQAEHMAAPTGGAT
jgi:hypothetical protein